jgi:hypothetical protein
MLTLEEYYVGTDVLTNTFQLMSKNTSTLSWTRRVRFEKMGFHAEPMPDKIVAAKCYLPLNEKEGKLSSIPLQASVKLILDDEFKTHVGRAWGYRLVVFEDEIYAELDLILEQSYMDIHGSVANQLFIVEECFFENDESTEFKSLQVEKIFTKPTFSKLLPSRIHSVEEVEKVQNFILRRSTKWHTYRNYHDWFAFFLDKRLEMFN